MLNQDQIDALNRYQKCGFVHPYSCGGNRTDEKHLDGEGVLVATAEGWVCPYCDYRQEVGGCDPDGVHAFLDSFEAEMGQFFKRT